MTRAAFEEIKAGLEDAIAYAAGRTEGSITHIPSDIDVKGIRKALKLKQSEFAQRYGFGLASVRDWEQGRSKPTGAVRAYLLVIQREHEAVDRALRAA
ncbi:MAG: helix-turn-helix domain-containing protein [Rhizobiales bacterium]|nr:helix-turn-helix domain-containing protein [Hyphomicrobiales bacterium]